MSSTPLAHWLISWDITKLHGPCKWTYYYLSWYNYDHHHSGIGLLTPASLHYGQAQAITQHRRQVLQAAYHSHPERFVHGVPHPPSVPTEVWITPPIVTTSIQYPLDE